MTKQIAIVVGMALCVGDASAQMSDDMGAAASIVSWMDAGQSGGTSTVLANIVASLAYDGTSTIGFIGQDFPSTCFDPLDIYCCERFGITADANLTEFRSTGFGLGDPFATTDVIAEIYLECDLANLCDDSVLPPPLFVSDRGAGFYDGVDFVTSFSNACLPAGDYVIRWAVELNLRQSGLVYFYGQSGNHGNGTGTANDGFRSTPAARWFPPQECLDTIDAVTGLRTGVNFILCGDVGVCNPCPDPKGCGDWDGDCNSDFDDWFAYFDDFVSGDPCADLDSDGDFDRDDFFRFMDRFIMPC